MSGTRKRSVPKNGESIALAMIVVRDNSLKNWEIESCTCRASLYRHVACSM
jgi:hypothetical protein